MPSPHRSGRSARFEFLEPEALLKVVLLGPMVVSRDGTRLAVTGPKRRALLTFSYAPYLGCYAGELPDGDEGSTGEDQ